MMKKIILVFSLLSLLLSCNGNKADKQKNGTLSKEEFAEVTIDSLTLYAKKFVGKKIRVTGIVEHVCVHTEKRLTITGPSHDFSFKVNASNAVPEFDLSLKGSKVEVTGIFNPITTPNEVCEVETSHHPGENYYIECQSIKVK